MKNEQARGLPARMYVPILVIIAAIFIALMWWFVRVGLSETGTTLGPSGAPTPQVQSTTSTK